MIGLRWETIRMSGWTRPQLFWTVLSCGHKLCGAHVSCAHVDVEPRNKVKKKLTSCRPLVCSLKND
jgi:hypothetical protein